MELIIRKTLASAIRSTLEGREITQGEWSLLSHEISKCEGTLIPLWIATVRNSRMGRSKEGKVLSRWSKENEVERLKLEAIKKKGADAKWSLEPYDPSTVQKRKLKNLEAFKKALEAKLTLNY